MLELLAQRNPTLVGGHGRLLVPDIALDLDQLQPYVGLSRDSILAITGITVPSPGLVAIENLTVFEACCRAEVRDLGGAVYVWTAGYPGRGVRAIVSRVGALVDMPQAKSRFALAVPAPEPREAL